MKQRRLRIPAFVDLGDACVLLAADKTAPPATIAQSWLLAREMYQSALGIAQKMKASGLLFEDELAEMDNVARKIDECNKALQERPAPVP